MKLKAQKSFRHESKTYRKGAEFEATPEAGKDLVARGFAVEVASGKSAPVPDLDPVNEQEDATSAHVDAPASGPRRGRAKKG